MSRHHLTDRLTEAATAAAGEGAREDALSIAVLHTAESLLKNADWQTDVRIGAPRAG
jgi:hypothetical protein